MNYPKKKLATSQNYRTTQTDPGISAPRPTQAKTIYERYASTIHYSTTRKEE